MSNPHPDTSGMKPFSKNDPERARAAQKKAIEQRKKNKIEMQTIQKTMREELRKPVTNEKQLEILRKSGYPIPKKPTYIDYAVVTTLNSVLKKASPDMLLKLMEVIGEKVQQQVEEASDDSLIEALSATAADDWSDEE